MMQRDLLEPSLLMSVIAVVTHPWNLAPTSLDMSDNTSVAVDILRSPTAGAIQNQLLTSP
jgi:hypothetical protein